MARHRRDATTKRCWKISTIGLSTLAIADGYRGGSSLPITRSITVSVWLVTCLTGAVWALPEQAEDAAGHRRRTIGEALSSLPVVQAVVTRVEPRPADSTEYGKAANLTLEVTKVYCGAGVRLRDTISVVAIDGF